MSKTILITGIISFTDPANNPNRRAVIDSVSQIIPVDSIKNGIQIGKSMKDHLGTEFIVPEDYQGEIIIKVGKNTFIPLHFFVKIFIENMESNYGYIDSKSIKPFVRDIILMDADYAFNYPMLDDFFREELMVYSFDPHHTRKTFKFWDNRCHLEIDSYADNNRLALRLRCAYTGGVFTDCSINDDDTKLENDEFLVNESRDHNEHTMIDFLESNGIANKVGVYNGMTIAKLIIDKKAVS